MLPWLPIILIQGSLVSFQQVGAQYVSNSSLCAFEQFWCQDRCGSDTFGDTCCQTPTDGVYNMCGTGTTCCIYGCCPFDSTCNDVGACVRTITTTNSAGQSITSTTTIVPPQTTRAETDTVVRTLTVSGHTVVVSATDYITLPTVTATTVISTIGLTITVVPPISTVVQTITASGETVIVSGTESVTLITVTETTVITTFGQTITLLPPVTRTTQTTTTSATETSPTETSPTQKSTTLVSPNDTSTTQTLPTDTSATQKSPTQTSATETSPTEASPTRSSTTQTLPSQTDSQQISAVTTTTLPGGVPVVIVGTNTLAVPTTLSTQLVETTDGVTLTFEPGPTSPTTTTYQPTTSTLSGSTKLLSTEVITSTESGVVVIIIGTNTIPSPTGIMTTLTLTTDGVTLTLVPTSTVNSDTTATTYTTSATTTTGVADVTSVVGITATGPLTTYTTWPPLTLFPVTTSIDGPQPTRGGTVVPCHLWFFTICLNWRGPSIFGWFFPLPPGIYPPGPPPGIQFPPWISISGPLPPWPSITIGNDNLPTYSPEPTSCNTKTARLCPTTTSYGVSMSGTITTTTGSQVISTCETIIGCKVEDESSTTTIVSSCASFSTVTNAWVSCATITGSAKVASCTTTSTALVSGCGVTPTTRKCTSTTTIQGVATGTSTPGAILPRSDGDFCVVDNTDIYVIYPMDSRNSGQTSDIATTLGTMADESDINTLTVDGLGIIYWQLPLSSDQASALRKNLNVRSVFIPCPGNCYDPTIELVEQPQSPDTLVFVDQFGPNLPISWYNGNYVFDQSAGAGVTVYMMDSGMDIEHPEFTTPFTKGVLKDIPPVSKRTRYIFIGSTARATEGHDTWGHGTSVMSQITGWSLGISKFVSPVVVQVNVLKGDIQFLQGLAAIIKDMEDNKDTIERAVLCMSLFWPSGELDNYEGTSVQAALLLNQLAAKGVLPIVGSGNLGSKTIVGLPAGLAVSKPADIGLPSSAYVPDMLVVGAVDVAGTLWPRTNQYAEYGLPHIYAPGFDVKTAWANPPYSDPNQVRYYQGKGTSIATAKTCGLAAYLIGLKLIPETDRSYLYEDISTPAALKAYLMKLSWPRVAGYPAIYNGLDWVDAGSLSGGPSCPIVQRDIVEGQLPSMSPCPINSTSALPSSTPNTFTTFITSTLPGSAAPPASTAQLSVPPGSSCLSTAVTSKCSSTSQPCTVSIACLDWTSLPPSPTPTSADTSTSTTTTSGVTSTSELGSCTPENVDIDCGGPVLMCHGGSVARCQDSKCVCVAATPIPITTTTSNTPTRTSTRAATPTPVPTEGVYINWAMLSVGGDGVLAANDMWNMFDVTLSQGLSLCLTQPIATTQADGSIAQGKVPWPPSFGSSKDISGRNNCQYIGKDDGPGQFACDGVNAFQCIVDSDVDKLFPCYPNFGEVDTYVPKVRCLFPIK